VIFSRILAQNCPGSLLVGNSTLLLLSSVLGMSAAARRLFEVIKFGSGYGGSWVCMVRLDGCCSRRGSFGMRVVLRGGSVVCQICRDVWLVVAFGS
jgi:hypothetical protein